MSLTNHTTVNSLYRGHCRDLKLVSSVARVRNGGSLFQSNVCNLFLPGIYLLSVLSGCPLQRAVRKARSRVDCIICLYYCPQRLCNFHTQVFQIKLKYYCSKPIKLQKFFMSRQYKDIHTHDGVTMYKEILDGQPARIVQGWRNMVNLHLTSENTGSKVLNFLKLLHVLFSGARLYCRAIKKFSVPNTSEFRIIKSMDLSKGCRLNPINFTQNGKKRGHQSVNMSIESQTGIKINAQISTSGTLM